MPRHFIIILQVIVFSAILLLSGCAQREEGVGVDAITNVGDKDYIRTETLATASSPWERQLSNGLGLSLQIGNAADFIASSVIRFDLTDALPDSHTIERVNYRLSTYRVWPQGGAPDLEVVVKEVLEEWAENSLIPDTLQFVDSYPVLDSIPVPAEQDCSMTYALPEEIFQRWMDGDTTTFGLYFEPINEGVMIEFLSTEGGSDSSGQETIPLLEIEGRRWDLNEDSVWIESALDTVIFAIEDAYTTKNLAEPAPGRIHVTAGHPQRALFYFPLDSLTQFDYRQVARSEMWIYSDSLDPAVMGYLGENPVFKDGSLETSGWKDSPDSLDTIVQDLIATDITAYDATNTVLRFNVTGIVNEWHAQTHENGGFEVLISGEDQFLLRQVFHAHDTEDDTKKPKLVIWYVEPSN